MVRLRYFTIFYRLIYAFISQIASLSIGRDAIGVALLGESLLAVGGYDGTYLKTVEKYDAETNEWNQLAPLNNGRAGCVVAVPNHVPTSSTV